MVGLVVEEDPARVSELFAPIRPPLPMQFERVAGWTQLIQDLRGRVAVDDLVVVLSARRGTLPWHPKLERLPTQLAGLLPESFLIFFPSEADTPRRDPVVPSVLPRGLRPDRITFDIPPSHFEEALRTILRKSIDDAEMVERITAILVEGEREFSTEVRRGVVVPHARVQGIDEPVLFLGTCPQGIEFPQARDPANLIFVLLSPADRPQEHLRSLAEIARLVSREEYVEELLGGKLIAQAEPDLELGIGEPGAAGLDRPAGD